MKNDGGAAFGYQPTERDWPQDFAGENGMYMSKCCLCSEMFVGHKRRVVCQKCATAAATGMVPGQEQEGAGE